MKRIAGSLVVLALVAATGCSRSSEDGARPASVQARDIRAIYADILAQRDRVRKATSKGTEMWHEDCAEVSAAAAELETLLAELQQRAAATPELAGQMTGLESHVGLTLGVLTSLRDNAAQEVVGMLPPSANQLDAYLRGLESHFTPEQLGGESIENRPGFDPSPPAAPLSPV